MKFRNIDAKLQNNSEMVKLAAYTLSSKICQMDQMNQNTNYGIFQSPDQVDRNLTPLQCVEEIASFFASISQEYEPININDFPPDLRLYLTTPTDENLPILHEYKVYRRMKKARKPDSYVNGELHPKVMKHFLVEFSAPATLIFNNIISTQKYPNQWKVEFGTPLPKTDPEMTGSCDDIRIISKKHFLRHIDLPSSGDINKSKNEK